MQLHTYNYTVTDEVTLVFEDKHHLADHTQTSHCNSGDGVTTAHTAIIRDCSAWRRKTTAYKWSQNKWTAAPRYEMMTDGFTVQNNKVCRIARYRKRR